MGCGYVCGVVWRGVSGWEGGVWRRGESQSEREPGGQCVNGAMSKHSLAGW